jgi:hypothetical protein
MTMDPIERERDRDVDGGLDDQWLESTLIQFGKAEPRVGLENRLLANLRAERAQAYLRRRWWRALGMVASLAAILVAVRVEERDRERKPESTAATSTTNRAEARELVQPRPIPQIVHPATTHPAREVVRRRPAHRPTRDLAVASTPKLAQFPSPQPLSEQERILASYVAKYPEHAALVAQARAEALQQDSEEEAAGNVGNIR